MTDVDKSATIKANFLDPATQDDPFEAYDEVREHDPVHNVGGLGMYMVTGYADVREMLTDPATFSSDPLPEGAVMPDMSKVHQQVLLDHGWAKAKTLQRTDPPVHTHYRKMLNRVFTPRRVKDLTPRIEQIAAELVDAFIDKGQCEFVKDFALPLPGIVICEQLGLPASEYRTFKRWADAMLSMTSEPMTEEVARKLGETELEAQLHLAEEFDRRRAEPSNDLISALVHAHGEDDEPLTMEELQDLMHQLITGGFETTTSALGTGMWLLLRYPDAMAKLRDDRSLMKNFIEESLRFDSPVAGLFRTATDDITYRGTDIPKGAMVQARYAAANRDPAIFENPHEFDIERENATAHVAFGIGNHFCIGAALARAELMAGFNAVLDRMDDIELSEPLDDLPHEFNMALRPMKKLPLKFTKHMSG